MPGPAATIGSMHVCPLVNGTVPHVGGPVSGPGVPTVLICGKPAAVMGDMCVCTGPPDTIVQGEATVLIGGKPAVTIGCMTAHGGAITVGEPTVLIGTSVPISKSIMPLKEIPFPKINVLDDVGAAIIGKGKSHQQGKDNIEQIKKEAEKNDPIKSEEYTISSKFALDQATKLANQLSEANFMAIMVKIFGTDVPFDAYSQLYKDLSDEKIVNVDIEVLKESIYGYHIAYNTRRNVICMKEAVLKEAIENIEKRLELLAALTEEFGHHIDYLLRNKYSNVGGDAQYDEGAVFAFRVFDIDLLEQSYVPIGEVTSPGFNGTLEIDMGAEHADFKQFVNDQAQLDDGKSPDGTYEFFNAGLLETGYGHENIDKRLRDIGYSEEKDLPHVFLGNWLRDYSQIICGKSVRMSETAQVQLKNRLKNKQDFARILELHSGKLSRQGLTNIIGLLAAKEFIYDKQKDKWNEYNANECKAEFEKMFGKITPEVLGCYRPEEHIDNPKGLADETYIDPDFFIGCLSEQILLNLKSGQKKYIKESFTVRPSATRYINVKLLSAAKKGRTPEGLVDLGAALHVLEDYFAHTNFVEICLVKLVNDEVYTWVEDIVATGANPNTLGKEGLIKEQYKIVAKPYKSTNKTINARASCTPVVSGVFGNYDMFATLCSKLRQMFELPSFEYIPTEPGQRSFADLAIITILGDMAKGQNKDAAKKNNNYKGTDYAGMLDKYKYFLKIRDWKAKKIKEGGTLGTTLKFADIAGSTMATLISYPYALALNVLLYALETSVKEAETYSRDFGTDPTHTQLNKDDPAHPINDLAGELAVIAVKKIGGKIIDIWDGKTKMDEIAGIIDDVMSHPCKTDWMDKAVIAWAAKNQYKVRRLEKSSYIQIAKEQQQKLMAAIEDEKQYRDLAYNSLINYYEQKHA